MRPPRGGRPIVGNDWTELSGQVAGAPPSVSVVVVHYEQHRQLARTLLALERQEYPGEIEIIVVDDGSAQPPSVPPEVRLVLQTRDRARRSAARNRGARSSHGDVLCFLDADTVPEPEYVAQLTRLPALAPEAITVGWRRHASLSREEPGTDVEVAGPANELPGPGWLSEGYADSDQLRRAGPRAFRFMISAVLSCTRWFYEEVGGFDETFDMYGGEDWEWAHRAWLCGAVFAHVPEAVAWHDGPDWDGRHVDPAARAAARAEKNAETMRLAQLIGVEGHRPRGLLASRAEFLIEFEVPLTPAASFVCVDSLLGALPRSVVLVPDELAGAHGTDPRVIPQTERQAARAAWPGLHITVHAAFTLPGEGLGEGLDALCQAMLMRDEGLCHLHDDRGELLQIESARHRVRTERWGAAPGLAEFDHRPGWLLRLTEPPDVEAYLGGWRR